MLSLATLILAPSSVAISSSAGAIILQGPHHSAQKSTTTGWLASSTSDLKLLRSTLTVAMTVNPSELRVAQYLVAGAPAFKHSLCHAPASRARAASIASSGTAM